MNEKVSPTASNRRKRELAREEDLLTYKIKRKTIDPSTVVPPNTVDTVNEDVSEPVTPTESAQAVLGAQAESAQAVNILQGLKFKTESAQAALGAQPLFTNVSPNSDVNIPIVGGYSEGEGATSNEDVGASDKSLLKSFRFHRVRSIVLGQLDKVLSDGTAAAAKNKGLTARSVARAYMLYVLGWFFLFPTENGTNISARYLDLFAKDKVAKK
ncbi:hypothetical protein GIB67_042612 [Kingdonia uniflora]|uniref:Uncharacterized protein n=1 Tax=Kingdonia uniflora TaxID=39325 RepID=A0A7J7M1B5_9MAGN|nr:hypothetical protein GIB67_042612 [Kingdonia uniflora]